MFREGSLPIRRQVKPPVPMSSRSNCGGLSLAQGATPFFCIRLPIVELLSSAQVVQNFSDSGTSTTFPLSSTTSTEPQSLGEVAVAISV